MIEALKTASGLANLTSYGDVRGMGFCYASSWCVLERKSPPKRNSRSAEAARELGVLSARVVSMATCSASSRRCASLPRTRTSRSMCSIGHLAPLSVNDDKEN